MDEESLPPPSPTFYRAPPQERDVYLVCDDEDYLPDIDNWVVLEVNLKKPMRWLKTPKKDAIVLVMPGTYNFVTLGLERCPYTRLEIIGAAKNHMHVLLTGTPKGIKEAPAINVSLMKNEYKGLDTRLQMRVNNVSIRQERETNAVKVESKHFLELDTVSVFSRDINLAAIESSRQGLMLLRNVCVTSERSAVVGGGGLIVLNSLFSGCGSNREDEMDAYGEDEFYTSDPAILIEHHTHFFMSNSVLKNNVGHAVGKRIKFEFDAGEHERLGHFIDEVTSKGLMNLEMGKEAYLTKIITEKKEVEQRPEGYRRIRSVTLKNNRSCNPLCNGLIENPEIGHCPDLNDMERFAQQQGFENTLSWVSKFVQKPRVKLAKEHKLAAEKWNLGELVDPGFLADSGWKKYSLDRKKYDEINANDKEMAHNGGDLTRSELQEKMKTPLKRVLDASALSSETKERFLNSFLFVKLWVDWEVTSFRPRHRTFESTCRLYSLCGTGAYVDLHYRTHFRARWSSAEDFDTLRIAFVGQPGGENLFLQKDIDLIIRDTKYVPDNDREDYEDPFNTGEGPMKSFQERIVADTKAFDALQGVLFGKKVMSLPKFIEVLWASVGGNYYSRSHTGVGFAVKIAQEREPFQEGEERDPRFKKKASSQPPK